MKKEPAITLLLILSLVGLVSCATSSLIDYGQNNGIVQPAVTTVIELETTNAVQTTRFAADPPTPFANRSPQRTNSQNNVVPATPSAIATITFSPTQDSPAQNAGDYSRESEPQPGNWPLSLIFRDIEKNYPLTTTNSSGTIRLHYQPDTYPAEHMGDLSRTIDDIWEGVQTRLGYHLNRPIDVYLAGTLFETNPGLRGLTRSGLFQVFVLRDGAAHFGEEDYVLAHELVHLAATYAYLDAPGDFSSVMLHEGLAVYLAQDYLTEKADYLPLRTICAAVWQTEQFKTAVELDKLDYGSEGFGGHIRTFIPYNLAGCFVGFLIETYGIERFAELYRTGDYQAVYGQTLDELDTEWQRDLAVVEVTMNAESFVIAINEVASAYATYLDSGNLADWETYVLLNQARLLVHRGQVRQGLDLLPVN